MVAKILSLYNDNALYNDKMIKMMACILMREFTLSSECTSGQLNW